MGSCYGRYLHMGVPDLRSALKELSLAELAELKGAIPAAPQNVMWANDMTYDSSQIETIGLVGQLMNEVDAEIDRRKPEVRGGN